MTQTARVVGMQPVPEVRSLGTPAAAMADEASNDRAVWLFRRTAPSRHPLFELIRGRQAPAQAAPLASRAGQDSAGMRAPEALRPPTLDDRQIARRIHDLPPLPRALAEALRVVRRDDLCADSCVRAIEQDTALAARLLRLANSPFYGVSGRVSSIGDAVRLLGLRTVAGVVAAVSMHGMLAQWRDEDGQFQRYWKHTVATALAARELACAAGSDPDEAFLAGLLHDIGRLALAVFVPDQARQVMACARAQDIDPRELERPLIGRTHDEVGAALAHHWQLPADIVSAIALHHQPRDAVDSAIAGLEAIVHVADAIAHAMDLVGDAAEAVPPVDTQAWLRVGQPDAAMQKIFERVEAGVMLLASEH